MREVEIGVDGPRRRGVRWARTAGAPASAPREVAARLGTAGQTRPVTARILLFALEDLRALHGPATPAGADPRHDTAAFRAFRAALLGACAAVSREPAELSMWWEGTYNGYALAVAVEPPGALAGLDLSAACPADAERIAPPRRDRYPLARVAPGRAEIARDARGGAWEAPLGSAGGHFGAPGMRRVT